MWWTAWNDISPPDVDGGDEEGYNILNETEDISMKTLALKVDGMMCGGCSARLQRVLEALPQVESCKADYVTKAVQLVLKEDLPLDAIRKAIEAAGFKLI